MKFPNKVTFKLIDKETKKPIFNIATLLVLYAHRKNNYSVGIMISDENGFVHFTENDCLKEIENSKTMFLMDYSSDLEDCLPKVSLEIMADQQIKRVIKERRENREIFSKYWDCSEEFLQRLEKVDNSLYMPKSYDFTEADLWEEKVLEIQLEKVK